jgi:hypothetical protein
MGVINKLKGRMQGPMKAGFPVTQNNTSETSEQDTQVSVPFNSNDSAKMALILPGEKGFKEQYNDYKVNKRVKDAGKFGIKQAAKQVLKKAGAAGAGVFMSLLSPTTVHSQEVKPFWERENNDQK